MIIPNKAQPAIPFGGAIYDGTRIWNPELAQIDEILSNDKFIDILIDAFHRKHPNCSNKGAPRMALNRVLRTGILKHIKNWSFRQTVEEMQRNLDYRAFTQFFDDKIPTHTTLSRNIATIIDKQVLRELNDALCQLARENKVIAGKNFRQDTTVSETNIHHPTDSTLMHDGVRVLTRVVKQVEALLPSMDKMRDRSRAALHRVLEINRAARDRTGKGEKRREKAYRSFMKMTRSVVSGAKKALGKLTDGRVTRHLDPMENVEAEAARSELQTMVPRVEKVLRQTRVRICRGVTNYPDKILSLFVPETYAIRKGKANKPTEFGRLIEVVEVENGFVSDLKVHHGNPADQTLFIPALERHKQRFGYVPRNVATDRGFWSRANEQKAYEMGVKRVAVPFRGRLSAARRMLQRTRWFRLLQRWRANGEGRIGTLKNQYGLDRCMYKGKGAMERWAGWCAFANNLMVVARRTKGRPWMVGDEKTFAAERKSHQKAA